MSNNDKKFVIFDLDGTLIDSYECVLRCVNKVLVFFDLPTIESLSHTEDKGDIREIFDIVREIVKGHISYEYFKVVFDYEHYNSDFESIKLNKNILNELLNFLNQDYRILILTNKMLNTAYKIVRKILPEYDIDIIGRTDVMPLKTDPLRVKNIISEHNYDVRNCLFYYGDSIEDEILSSELGIPYIKILH